MTSTKSPMELAGDMLRMFTISTTAEGSFLTAPSTQLDVKVWKNCKKLLEAVGGVYKTGKNKGFQFTYDVSGLLPHLYEGQHINLKQIQQFFHTPEDVVDEMHNDITIYSNKDRILEPHAGRGHLASTLRSNLIGHDLEWVEEPNKLTVDCIEIDPVNRAILAKKEGLNLLPQTNYLEQFFPGQYFVVAMNPPFNGKAYFKNRDFTGEDWAKGGVNELPDFNGAVGKDYEHFRKGFHDVTPGGTISSVMSRSWFTKPTKDVKSFRRWLGIKDDGFLKDFAENPKADDMLRWEFSYKGFTHSVCLRCIPADWFKESGTTVATCILTVHKAGIYKDRNKGTDPVLLQNFEFDY